MTGKQKEAKENGTARTPLFTGDYRRDTAVSELEKTAEASFLIREAIMKLSGRKQEK